jgi:hypothetical protein
MKHSRIFRISAVAIVLALMLTAIPATPALAQSVTSYPYSGPVGTMVTVAGTNFTAGDTYTITFAYGTTFTQVVHSGTVVGTTFAPIFPVPVVPRGQYIIYTQTTPGPYSTYFTVTPQITLSPSSGYVGSTVTVSGTGFNASSSVTIYFDTTAVGTATASASGTFTGATFTVPESCQGSHTIKGSDATGPSPNVTFTTSQKITLSPTSGAVGDEVTVSGTGFRATKPITITFDGDTVTTSPATVTTDDDGSFSNTTFTIPTAVNDIYELKASDGLYTNSFDFSVVAGVTISPITTQTSPGHVGETVTVSGTGFLADHLVTITYLSTPITVATTTTDANGDFSTTFEVPASEGGAHTITATDDTNTITSTFTMESTPPSTVYPQLPLMDTKLKGWRFDWCGDDTDLLIEVTDDSLPITYTLQIATDNQFTTTSILLEKTGLTESEYTLTSEEKLPSVEKEAPYYWRVKAIDSASNESEWTDAGSFYVGFIFDMPTWLIYTLFGLGTLLFGVFGFWLGRRTAYS